ALFRLFVLSNKAALRRTFRGVKSVRGVLLLLFTMGFIGLMLVPQIFAAIAMNAQQHGSPIADRLEPFAPLFLLLFALLIVFTSAGEKALYFTPPEVDFLFPAPFSRHELLIYKLVKSAVGLLIVALFFSMLWGFYFRSWLSAFVGILLSLAMLQLLGMAVAMAGQIVAESIYSRARKILLAAVLIAMVVGLGQVARYVEARGITEV